MPLERKLAILNQLAVLALTVAMIWFLIPQHKRKSVVLTCVDHGRRYVLRLAAWNGRRGMDLELEGDLTGADRHYEMAYQLMTERVDKLVELYRKLQ